MTFKHAISVSDFPLACLCGKCLIWPVVLLHVASTQVDSGEDQVKSFALRWRKIHAICFSRSLSYDYTLDNEQILGDSFYSLSLYRNDRFSVSSHLSYSRTMLTPEVLYSTGNSVWRIYILVDYSLSYGIRNNFYDFRSVLWLVFLKGLKFCQCLD